MKKIIILFCLLVFNSAYSQVNLIPFIKNGKWGYCDKEMKVIIPCKYDQAYPFFEDRALVQIYDTIEPYAKSFFIDPKGNVAINLNSSSQGCPASRFQNGVAVVENYNIPIFGEGSNLCVIDKNGNLIHQIDSATMDMDLSMFREYSSAFNDDGVYISQIQSENESKSLLIFNDDRKPIALNYQYVSTFNAGYAVAQEPFKEVGIEPNLALINSKGEEVIPAGKYKLTIDFTTISNKPELLFPFEKDGKHGYLNEKGEVIIEPKFDLALYFSEGRALIAKSEGYDEYDLPIFKYGYIDTKGDIIIPCRFDQAYAFSDGLAEVVIKDSILFIDKNGKTELAFHSIANSEINVYPEYYGYYYYDHGFKDGTAPLVVNNKVGFINKKGEFVIEPLYNGLGSFEQAMVVNPIENGIVKLSSPISLSYFPYYINMDGKGYFEPRPLVLPIKNSAPQYPSPSKNSLTDSLGIYYAPVFVKYTGIKEKIKGKKGEWIEIDNWGIKAFVFSADFYTTSVVTKNIKGNELYESKNGKIIFDKIPAGSILFLPPKEKISKIGSNEMVNVIYYTTSTETDTGFTHKFLWIKGDKIKLLNK
jgi:hypothetical protein